LQIAGVTPDKFGRNAKLVAVALAALYVSRYLQTWAVADTWTLLDNIDLAIHEAGHIVFMPFGEFMTVLGGSLFQILVPAVFVGYFARQRDWFSSAYLCFWLGQSCFNLSYYIADARAHELPLLSDDPTSHDWTWLLLQTGLLNHDTQIGNAVRIFGLLLFATAAVVCCRVALYVPEKLHSFSATTPMITRQVATSTTVTRSEDVQ
jgi:hypothetical protein